MLVTYVNRYCIGDCLWVGAVAYDVYVLPSAKSSSILNMSKVTYKSDWAGFQLPILMFLYYFFVTWMEHVTITNTIFIHV